MTPPTPTPTPIPTIHHPTTLASFFHWLLQSHSTRSAAPTLVIICSTRAAFLQTLSSSIAESTAENDAKASTTTTGEEADATDETPDGDGAEREVRAGDRHPLLSQTLHTLATSQTIKLAFVSSVPVLLAYLTGLPPSVSRQAGSDGGPGGMPLLALVNLVSLHDATGDWSAQALGRSVGLAVEAAERWGGAFVGVECGDVGGRRSGAGRADGGDGRERTREPGAMQEVVRDDAGRHEGEGEGGVREGLDPWEQQMPVLSASTRTFGGDRGWSERTVKISDVVGRWCIFREPPNPRTQD